MSEEAKIPCPQCHSDLTISLANQRHCNNCGNDFAVNRDPIGTRAQMEKRGLWTSKPTNSA